MRQHPEPHGSDAGRPRIAIIGRGFSGAAAAAALLRRVQTPFSLILIDKEDTLGGGIAYGKARAGELLNVRAFDLALLAEERGEFARWLEPRIASGESSLPVEQLFAPRALFRDYVREKLLSEMLRRPDVSVQTFDGEAVSLKRQADTFCVGCEDGRNTTADFAVLATGYGAGCRFGRDPFEPLASGAIERAQSAVIVGSGLTMIDLLLRLRRDGFVGKITIISRHGLTPLSQLTSSSRNEVWTSSATSLRVVLKEVRRACDEAVERGVPWQAVINSLRPETQRIWNGFSNRERRRFRRHLRPYWDIHRHRVPADIHAEVACELARDRTEIRKGRVISVEGEPMRRVAVRWRGKADVGHIDADLVFDCSGHSPNLNSPLLKSLLDSRLAAIDALGMGLDVGLDGSVQSASGSSANLYAIGPLCTGTLLEITAAPEIAVQAGEMARGIGAEIEKRRSTRATQNTQLSSVERALRSSGSL